MHHSNLENRMTEPQFFKLEFFNPFYLYILYITGLYFRCVHFPKEERLQSLVLEVFATSTGESEAGGGKLHKVYQQLSPPSRKKILLTISGLIV